MHNVTQNDRNNKWWKPKPYNELQNILPGTLKWSEILHSFSCSPSESVGFNRNSRMQYLSCAESIFFFFRESITEFYRVLLTFANEDLAVIFSVISSRKIAMCAFLIYHLGSLGRNYQLKLLCLLSLYTWAWQDQFMQNNHKIFALLFLIYNTLTVELIAKFLRDLWNEISKSKFLNVPWETKSWDCVCVLWKFFSS